jgi:HJR/Mrr/RecB family endonuclease
MSDWIWDHALIPFVTRVPGLVVAAVALLFYPGIGLVLPLVLGWPTNWLISINLIGVTAAALLSIGYLVVLVQAKDRRHLLEWTTDLRLLTAAEFEYLVGELFRREGWNVAETGRQDGPDGNIDLVLTRGRKRRIVQCKRWTSWLVGVKEVRAFAGTLMSEGASGKDGIFVTLSNFTEQAEEEAKRTGIALLDGADLLSRVEKVRRQEPCPICDRPMLFDRSSRGWWFRCVTEGCAGKRDLGTEAGRAIELLTQPPTLSPTHEKAA